MDEAGRAPTPTQTLEISPQRSVRKSRLRNDNFACETILFRLAPRKLLKSLVSEKSDFTVLCDFKGL